MSTPSATARLQFHSGFGFQDAIAIVPYLARLGISHIYASPIFTSRSGSTHGYDITDANAINPELGGRNGLARLVETLRAHGMGLVLDIVPNHMASAAPENAWFSDVLRYGRESRYADYFDIDWDNHQPQLTDKMLLPILAKPYAEVLQGGDITVVFDRGRGEFMLAYYDRRLPLAPDSQASILSAIPGLPLQKAPISAAELAKVPADRIAVAVAAFDSEDPAGQQRLHELLEAQHYRLAFWQNAADEINWRRFFEISDLIGMRVERDDVFEASHALIFTLYEDGLIDALRVDHVDGLAAPGQYCQRLRERLMSLHALRPVPLDRGTPLVWVEKILAEAERLEPAWQTDGTTGYEFINDVLRVLVDPKGEEPLTQFWSTACGDDAAFDSYETHAREQILSEHLAGEFERICALLNQLSNMRIETRDITGVVIRRALYALLINFRVYRIYARPGSSSAADLLWLHNAADAARTLLRPADHAALDALVAWFSGASASEEEEALLRTVLARFEQLSAPLAAKAVEDTAFYRYGRLIALNEVGGSPARFVLSTEAFHERMQQRQALQPLGLSPLATHDHKRGADARARLAVLSEQPEILGTLVREVATRLQAAATAPAVQIAAADLLMLLQNILGAWPLSLDVDDKAGCAELRERLDGWQNKALREAKQHSNWVIPVTDYEAVAHTVLETLFDDADLRRTIYQAVQGIAAAGAVNSLVQVLLQCTAPGIPDIYQGTDLWDFSLVDPDNRRPVDYALRTAGLEGSATLIELLATWRDGRVKQGLLARILNWRRENPAAFEDAGYRPINVEGPQAGHLICFARDSAVGTLAVIAPRSVAAFIDATTLAFRKKAWGMTLIKLLESDGEKSETAWVDLLTGGVLKGTTLKAHEVLAGFPIALLFHAR